MTKNKGVLTLFGIGLGAGLLYLVSRTAQAAATIQEQIISIVLFLVDVWVYRDGVWLIFSVPYPLTNTLDRLFPGESVIIQVTQAVNLTYGGNIYPLRAGQNTIIWR